MVRIAKNMSTRDRGCRRAHWHGCCWGLGEEQGRVSLVEAAIIVFSLCPFGYNAKNERDTTNRQRRNLFNIIFITLNTFPSSVDFASLRKIPR